MIDFLFVTLMLNLHTLKSFHSQMAKSTGLSPDKHNFDTVQSAVSVPVVNCVHACLVTKLCLTFCDTMDQPARLLCPWDFPGKNTGEGCLFLLQGTFWTQRSNPGVLIGRWILYPLNH